MAKDPWKYLNSITNGKESLVNDPDFESEYNPYLMNTALSYHADTVLIANELNILNHLDKRMQYEFLFNTIHKKFRRGSKWIKNEVSEKEQVIMDYYDCNSLRAREYAAIIPDDEIKKIKKELEIGGKK